MVGPPLIPYQPYQAVHKTPQGPGDARPTASKIIEDCKAAENIRQKTVLITGCSSGIGIATASALYSAGARLFLTARDMIKLEEVIDEIAKKGSTTDNSLSRPQAIEMHLDSLSDVRKAAEVIKEKTKTLDILICNAGIMAVPYSLTKDGLESHIGVNHFAHFLLFQLLSPLMLEAAAQSGSPSRVVSVSSSGHWFGGIRFEDIHFQQDPDQTYVKWQAYGQSKTANIYMCNAITRRFGARGITALSLNPGVIATNLARNLTQADYEDFSDSPELNLAFKNAEQGAATTVWAAVSPHFADVANGGRYLADCGESGPTKEGAHAADTGYHPHAYDEEKEERLWELSCETVGLPTSA